MITVVIPVGPKPGHKQWLEECLSSVRDQTLAPAEVLIIDDMADVDADPAFCRWRDALVMRGIPVRVWRSPWNIGVATAFNIGVGLSKTECVFMLGADDTIRPECLSRCLYAYEHVDATTRSRALFFVGVHYTDERPDPDQFIGCNACMVTRSLWAHTGGFPLESASGAPDAALISIMIGNPAAGQTIGVAEGQILYDVRSHPGQDTAQRGPWQGVIHSTRDIVTRQWASPEWCRKDP
jgi:glycosyltransferase involved in cell wall biosynthesis